MSYGELIKAYLRERGVGNRVYQVLLERGVLRQIYLRDIVCQRYRRYYSPLRSYENAYLCVKRHRGCGELSYWEGVGMIGDVYGPVEHAWVTDQRGCIIDLSWRNFIYQYDGDTVVTYWGIPLEWTFVEKCKKNPMDPVLFRDSQETALIYQGQL